MKKSLDYNNINNIEIINDNINNISKELYNKFDKVLLGYEEHEIALYTDMGEYYLPTEIEKYGVVGIEIKLI